MSQPGHEGCLAEPQSRSARGGGSSSKASAALLAERVIQRVLRGFFAESGSVALRYGVTPEQILLHLDSAGAVSQSTAVRQLHWVEDLAVAAACSDGHPRAWLDAFQHFQSVLLRAARIRLSEAESEVFVQRFWTDLEEETSKRRLDRSQRRSDRPALQDYMGTRPLRTWLIDRVLGRLETESAAGTWVPHRRAQTSSTPLDCRGPLRLAD